MAVLDELRYCEDAAALRARLLEISAPFGPLGRLDILTSLHEGRQQAICFMRLGTPEQERAFMKAVGVGRFGGEIVLVVDLLGLALEEDSGPSSQWSDFGPL